MAKLTSEQKKAMVLHPTTVRKLIKGENNSRIPRIGAERVVEFTTSLKEYGTEIAKKAFLLTVKEKYGSGAQEAKIGLPKRKTTSAADVQSVIDSL